MKYEVLEKLTAETRAIGARLDEHAGECGPHESDPIDEVIGLDELLDQIEFLRKAAEEKLAAVSKSLVDQFADSETSSVKRRGKLVTLANVYWPGPKFSDLLPDGIDPNAEEYAATVAQCRAAARDRLLRALKSSPEFESLVTENYNAVSLRSALTGRDATFDEAGAPVIPEELVGLVELNPRTEVRITKARK